MTPWKQLFDFNSIIFTALMCAKVNSMLLNNGCYSVDKSLIIAPKFLTELGLTPCLPRRAQAKD